MATPHQKLIFTLFLCSSLVFPSVTGSEGVRSSSHHHPCHRHGRHSWRPKKLFVFGDSYAGTGNNRVSIDSSWKEPCGITFPGKPAGRDSDGRVFTDFLAKFLGIKSPLAYRWRKYAPKKLKYGMNFAYGGTGVFDTITRVPYPNMTTQIDFFQQLLKDSIFTPRHIRNSVALVTLAGNDYATYFARNGSAQGFPGFMTQVVNQLALNLKRIYNLGVKKIAVTGLEPLGCLPENTATTSNFKQCNPTDNKSASFHNLLLQQAVAKLNNQTHNHHHGSPVVILDLYNAFYYVLQQHGAQPGSSMFKDPLKPCCMGINRNYSCGSVDAQGNKMYTLCQDPKSSFFWDSVHPTDAGWNAVYLFLQDTLEELNK